MRRSSAISALPSASPSSTSATSWSAPAWPNSISAASARNCRKAQRRCWWLSFECHGPRMRATQVTPAPGFVSFVLSHLDGPHSGGHDNGSKVAKPESPSEPFKRAVSVAVRSLAAEPELEVNFSSEPPSLKGLKARLPSPHRNLSAQDEALVRGTGD